MLRLPAVIVQRGGRPHDIEAKVTIRFEATSSHELEIRCSLKVVNIDVEKAIREDPFALFIEDGSIPRDCYEAILRGMRAEVRRRQDLGGNVPGLRATIEQAVIHPIDCRVYAHQDAGMCAIARVFDG